MTIVKKISVVAVSAALAALVALTMAGCGEQVAGSWAHGKVLEDEITKTLQERADRMKKTLEEIKANTNVEAMRRNEGIRRAADYVIEHSTIEEK